MSRRKDIEHVVKKTPRWNLQSVVFTTIGIVAIFVFIWVISTAEFISKSSDGGGGSGVKKGGNEKSNAICLANCERRREQQGTNHLLDRQELFQRASKAKVQLLDKLRKDYGDYFDPIFVDKDNGTYRPVHPMTKDGPSFERLRRKLLIKVLTMQLIFKTQDSDYHGCDCSNGKETALRNDVVDLSLTAANYSFRSDVTKTTFGKYVWATGGHSAAAGHGNLYNESYTAYMESDLKDIFESIGLEFEGRNYAMGGTASGPEISMCFKEVFGTDVDFFSWDYGMTDGKDTSKSLHYFYRGGVSAGRPALMMLHGGGRNRRDREERLRSLEDIGMPAFYGNEDSFEAMRNGFPDSSGISIEEINKLPEYVRNYKCGTSIEKGDPFCSKEKWTSYICPKRGKQTSWHPGFKDHAVTGHGTALFLMDALLSTLKYLSEHQMDDIDKLLSQLNQEEDELFTNITNAELPEKHNLLLKQEEQKIDFSLIYKSSSMCHTGRLPSQIRYLGYLTDTNKVGKPAPYGSEQYDVGIDQKVAEKNRAKNGTMPLVYELHKEREECSGDKVTVKPDYPDFFYTAYQDGWTKMIFPNEAEKKAYGYDPTHYMGHIFVHFKGCSWGKCPKNNLLVDDYKGKKWEMKINDQSVSSLANLGGQVVIAMGGNGTYFSPNLDGHYVIEIKVNEPNGFVRISSFVLY
mmetsp:Transcript_32189/g.36046  ORF Transcript_32189/g.36046 Transcript_32189/m.36046 type:complete len:688 (-) Transcript_32189:51-2114(-)